MPNIDWLIKTSYYPLFKNFEYLKYYKYKMNKPYVIRTNFIIFVFYHVTKNIVCHATRGGFYKLQLQILEPSEQSVRNCLPTQPNL